MKKAIVTLKGISPYSQGKNITEPKLPKELADAYELRVWRERMHVDENDNVIIPPMQFANSLKEAAKYLSLPVPGKGKQLFTKHFESGVMVLDPLSLKINKKDVPCEAVFVPANGQRGSAARVMKYFPLFKAGWVGEVTYIITDDIITEDIFRQVLEACGSLIGIGRFRPRNWGYYGRFEITKLKWIEN